MKYASLYLFFFIYFISTGFSTFVPKFYAEIGLSDGMIGVLSSVPTVIAMAVTPVLGLLTDRVPKKKYMLLAMMVLSAASCILIGRSTGSVLTLILTVTLYSIFSGSTVPIATTISLEYTREIHKDFGKVRLAGTVGYQVGALMIGYILSKSLNSLYPMMGVGILAACGVVFLMPDIKGHQHSKEKVPLSKLFADKHICWLFFIIFFATIFTQFYMAFYTKHLGDLGMSNASVSWVTLLSVLAELPFLLFADKIAKKTNIWNWLLFGMICNGIRWFGLAFSTTLPLIILFQIPAVTVMACFEFFPALYLSRRVAPELTGSAQSMLTLTTFGAAKIVGSLIGGQLAERVGIPTMFVVNGILTLAGAAMFWPRTRKLIREETVLSLSD